MPTKEEIMKSMKGNIPPSNSGFINRIMGVLPGRSLTDVEKERKKKTSILVSGVRG